MMVLPRVTTIGVNEIRLPKECPSCGYLKLKEEDYV